MIKFSSKIRLLFLCFIFAGLNLILADSSLGAICYKYRINLNQIVNDRFKVTLECQPFQTDTLIYCFPRVIPGTYEISNYGRFIEGFTAYDSTGKVLAVKRLDYNRFAIIPANRLVKISYWVNDTWEVKNIKKMIYPMAGTNIEVGRNFVWNNGGVFGFFQGHLTEPIEIWVHSPDSLFAITALPAHRTSPKTWRFNADSYYHLVDSPVMFAQPDTASFRVRNTNIIVGVDHATENLALAPDLTNKLSQSVNAIANFLDTLPTNHYTFIYYFSDQSDLGRLMNAQHFVIPKVLVYLFKNGLPVGGALEHANSSFYYLPDLGKQYRQEILNQATDQIAIHEFMHTLTPLRLHSAIVGNTDFSGEKMSQHLWLYEGVTEYFANLIRVQAGIISEKKFLYQIIPNKIRNGERYPTAKIPFTEMSAKVLQKQYKKHYNQVYERGAAMAMLLDLEIIRLTNGTKSLAEVVWELVCRYGVEHSFDEDNFIDEFVALVHPDLGQFFQKYVAGTEPLPYQTILQNVGIEYTAKIKEPAPCHYLKDNDVKTSLAQVGNLKVITKVGKKDFVGFQVGDVVNTNLYQELYLDSLGRYLPEGTVVQLPVIRAGQETILSFKIQYKTKTVQHRLTRLPQPSAEQSIYFRRWLKGKDSA